MGSQGDVVTQLPTGADAALKKFEELKKQVRSHSIRDQIHFHMLSSSSLVLVVLGTNSLKKVPESTRAGRTICISLTFAGPAHEVLKSFVFKALCR
jgi:hypothetical protein